MRRSRSRVIVPRMPKSQKELLDEHGVTSGKELTVSGGDYGPEPETRKRTFTITVNATGSGKQVAEPDAILAILAGATNTTNLLPDG